MSPLPYAHKQFSCIKHFFFFLLHFQISVAAIGSPNLPEKSLKENVPAQEEVN